VTDKRQELSVDEKFQLMLEALANRPAGGIDADALRAILTENAAAVQKSLKPENTEHPGYSSMAHPSGDKAYPRDGILKYPFTYCGYPMSKFPETEHWMELELAAKVQPGTYRVLRSDMSTMKVEVTAQRGPNDEITSMALDFRVSREEKANIPSKFVVLSQIVQTEGTPMQKFAVATAEYMKALQGTPVGV
jgi:hypothetical protein